MLDDIKEFHKKFELEPLENPGFLDEKLMEFRMKFMQEELDEFIEAYFEKDNLHDAFDALIDLTYVVLGTAYLMGLPFKEGWKLVHKANMNKIRAHTSKQSKRNNTSDVVKPEGWVAPNLENLLVLKDKLYICPAIVDKQFSIRCQYSNEPRIECTHGINHIYNKECDIACGEVKDLICVIGG